MLKLSGNRRERNHRGNDNITLPPDDMTAVDFLDAIEDLRDIRPARTPVEGSRIVDEDDMSPGRVSRDPF